MNTPKQDQIRGVITSSYPLNEYQIQSRLILTISDAQKLCETTKSGLPKHREARDMIIDQLVSSIRESISRIQSERIK